MPSIFDRDPPRPILTKGDSSIDLIIIIVTILLIVIFWLALTYTAVYDVVTNPDTRTGVNLCAPGQCATNQSSGEKVCPKTTDRVAFDPIYQICSSPTICDNLAFPYAVQPNDSTDFFGVCAADPILPNNQKSTCRCFGKMQCPDQVTSLFTTINGNPYTTLDGARTAFTQTPKPSNGSPLIFENPEISFCQIPLQWIYRSSPGCNFVEPGDNPTNTIIECMRLPAGTGSGPIGNPCMLGTLAYVPDDPDAFSSNSITTEPLSCVRGDKDILGNDLPCDSNSVAVWSKRYGGIICKKVK